VIMIGKFKDLYRQIPVIRELHILKNLLVEIRAYQKYIHASVVEQGFTNAVHTLPKYSDRRKVNHYEFQVFSQNGEDGIIREIFRRIGEQSRNFFEIGVGNGLENNTTFLLRQGWKGCWLEADRDLVAEIRTHFHEPLQDGSLQVFSEFVTAENVNKLLKAAGVPKTIDLLSLDIDRNTSHVWKALTYSRPRVVVIEYNASYPPDLDWEVEYDAHRSGPLSTYFGASLKALERIGREKGYALIGCDLSGTNAFFVSEDENLDLFCTPFTAENHHELPRYWSVRQWGHPRAYTDSQHLQK
jgi:hypothetical protein